MKNCPGWQGGSGKAKYGPECTSRYEPDVKLLTSQPLWGPQMGQGPFKMDPKWSPQLSMICIHFTDAQPISGGSGRVLSQQFCFGCIARGAFWAIFWPSRPPCQSDQIFMVQNGFYRCPAYNKHVLCSTRTSRGHFRPFEVIFTTIFAVSSDFLKRFHHRFSQIPQRPNFVIEILNLHIIMCRNQ